MNFVLKKEIDASLFKRGFAIPSKAQPIISAHLSGGAPSHGEKRAIKILLDDKIYDATLTSVNFDREKYPTHKDMWQIVYSAASAIASKFAEIFARSRAANFDLPNSEREYFVLYATDADDTFCAEPIFNREIASLASLDEISAENLIDRPILNDTEAALIEKFGLTKIRRLNREVGDYLKALYDFRCQICGSNVGKIYSAAVAECHHIDHFVRSLDNTAENLLILCPNHHRIIHAANPIFVRGENIFRYPNGHIEALTVNWHL